MSTAVASLFNFPTERYPRIDWFTVINEIERAGTSLAAQALHCDVAKGTLSYWKAGGEPKYGDGQQLLALYAQLFPGRATPIQTVKNLNGT